MEDTFMNNKALSDDTLNNINGGAGESYTDAFKNAKYGTCPKGVTEAGFPDMKDGAMGAHCIGRWYNGARWNCEIHVCDCFEKRGPATYGCTLAGYVKTLPSEIGFGSIPDDSDD